MALTKRFRQKLRAQMGVLEAVPVDCLSDCARCHHPADAHDDEFGNCMALPNPYGMNQRDGCDCAGYITAEDKSYF